MMDWEPNTDVVIDEAAQAVIVRAELAGADADSLSVSLDGRYLLISGCRAKSTRLRGTSYLQKEIADGSFLKRIHLPVSVQHADVVATYADGMLTITLPIVLDDVSALYMPAARTEIRMVVKRVLA